MIRTENLRSAFTKDDVDEYLYKLLPERDAVVREMEDYAAEHGIPIIGPAVARLLSLLVQVSGAKRIFEMGSAIGYSTIWLARAAGPKGKVFYTDGDPEKVRRAQMYFRMAGMAKPTVPPRRLQHPPRRASGTQTTLCSAAPPKIL